MAAPEEWVVQKGALGEKLSLAACGNRVPDKPGGDPVGSQGLDSSRLDVFVYAWSSSLSAVIEAMSS